MRIKVIGDSECARALRGLLRKAGFAVTEFLPAEVVRALPSGGYVIRLEEGPAESHVYFDSIDCELEASILRHVTQLSPLPVTVDRPGGQVRSDREVRIVVPTGNAREQAAVEFGVLRGLCDTVYGPAGGGPPAPDRPWYKRIFAPPPKPAGRRAGGR